MNPYLSILMLFLFALFVGGGFLLLSHFLAARGGGSDGSFGGKAALTTPYECGIDPVGSTRERRAVKFYLVAMLFILFDVEVVFLYPWAVLFKEFVASGQGVFIFVEMLVFLGILIVGLLYIYGRRALEWE